MDKKRLEEKYKNIKSISIKIKENKIYYEDKPIKENDAFKLLNSFKKLDENDIVLAKSSIHELPSTIYTFFESNIRKMSFLGLILPCILFLSISLISFSPFVFVENKGKFENFIFISFLLGIIYFLIALILLIRVIFGQKAYLRKVGSQTRLVFISKNKYHEMSKMLLNHSKNEHYYFESLTNNVVKQDQEYNLSLREFEIDDTKNLYLIFKNPNVFTYLLGTEFKNEEESLNWIENCIQSYKKKSAFKVAITINNTLIGYVGVSNRGYTREKCEIIYAIGEEYWGKEYVKEALNLFIPYLKKHGIEKIVAGHVEENEKSGKVLLKSGFFRDIENDETMDIHGENKKILSYIYGFNPEYNIDKHLQDEEQTTSESIDISIEGN